MTGDQWIEYLQSLPASTRALEIVCSAKDEDEWLLAAPWEPAEVLIAGAGVQRAIVVGFDQGRTAVDSRRQSPRPRFNQVVRKGSRRGCAGIAKGTKVQRVQGQG